MSLRHALLAVLTASPMTGYDLVKQFDSSIAFVWSAPKSQIYPELRRMEADELVEAEEVPRGKHATKRIYRVTERGERELDDWMRTPETEEPTRNSLLLRTAYFERIDSAAARSHLETHLAECQQRRISWTDKVRQIEQRRLPILVRRLGSSPVTDHEKIVRFKLLAYEGELSRLDAEIEWTRKALQTLRELHD